MLVIRFTVQIFKFILLLDNLICPRDCALLTCYCCLTSGAVPDLASTEQHGAAEQAATAGWPGVGIAGFTECCYNVTMAILHYIRSLNSFYLLPSMAQLRNQKKK